MIAGLIETHLGSSQYSVRISYDVTKANILIAWHNATIAERTAQKEQAIFDLNSAIANKVENLPHVRYSLEVLINLLSAEILQLTKSNEFIERNKGGEKVITAYSNIYDESLSGIVAVELIAGSIENPVIIANQPIEKRVTTAINMAKEHCFSNFALMTGWLKWAQKYSFARIDTAGAIATGTMASLNNKLSLIGGVVPFDKESISANNDYNYQLNDLALVEFDSNGNQTFKGWYKEPRQQSVIVVLFQKAVDGVLKYEAYNGSTGGLLWKAENTAGGDLPQEIVDLRAENDNFYLDRPSLVNNEYITLNDGKEITKVFQNHVDCNITWDYRADSVAYQKIMPRNRVLAPYIDTNDPNTPCYDPADITSDNSSDWDTYEHWDIGLGEPIKTNEHPSDDTTLYLNSVPGSPILVVEIWDHTYYEAWDQKYNQYGGNGIATQNHYVVVNGSLDLVVHPFLGNGCALERVSMTAWKPKTV